MWRNGKWSHDQTPPVWAFPCLPKAKPGVTTKHGTLRSRYELPCVLRPGVCGAFVNGPSSSRETDRFHGYSSPETRQSCNPRSPFDYLNRLQIDYLSFDLLSTHRSFLLTLPLPLPRCARPSFSFLPRTNALALLHRSPRRMRSATLLLRRPSASSCGTQRPSGSSCMHGPQPSSRFALPRPVRPSFSWRHSFLRLEVREPPLSFEHSFDRASTRTSTWRN